MFLFKIDAAFRGERDRSSDVIGAVLGAWKLPPSDGVATEVSPSAVAGIARWAVMERDVDVVPHYDREQCLLFAGDVRLHNRDDLKRTLGVPPSETLTDFALVCRAYLRWQTETPTRLVGDFAFAVWNERDRTLFAARDHLGIRPLHYRVTRDEIGVASDVRQLFPERGRLLELDAARLLERFTKGFRRHGLTFFNGISLLRPGHSMVANARGVTERRYWFPPAPRNGVTYRENCEILAATFRRAVHDRLESDRPIVAHSSGGFDSTTIVMAADELRRKTPGSPLVLASALTPGMPSDDGAYIAAVAGRVSFESISWNALSSDDDNITEPTLSSPGLRSGLGGGPRRDLQLARGIGARVLLAGIGGDDVRIASGIFRDLAANLRWRELAAEPAFRESLARSWRALPRSALGFLPPAVVIKHLVRRRTRVGDVPGWLGPELRALWPAPTEDLELVTFDWPSHVACNLWARVTRPHVSGIINDMILYGTHEGLEVRLPYLDVRLVEHFLTIPWHQRIPNGNTRRIGHDALGDLLPPEMLSRKGQGSWDAVWGQNCRRLLPSIGTLVDDGDWLSQPYVDRDGARQLLERVRAFAPGEGHAELFALANIGGVEAWLRGLARAGFAV